MFQKARLRRPLGCWFFRLRSCSDDRSEQFSGPDVVLGHRVRVQVQRDARVGMSHTGLNRLEVDAVRKKLRCLRVAEHMRAAIILGEEKAPAA